MKKEQVAAVYHLALCFLPHTRIPQRRALSKRRASRTASVALRQISPTASLACRRYGPPATRAAACTQSHHPLPLPCCSLSPLVGCRHESSPQIIAHGATQHTHTRQRGRDAHGLNCMAVYMDISAASSSSRKVSMGGHEHTRLRSPYVSLRRDVVGQNLACFSPLTGKAALARLYG